MGVFVLLGLVCWSLEWMAMSPVYTKSIRLVLFGLGRLLLSAKIWSIVNLFLKNGKFSQYLSYSYYSLLLISTHCSYSEDLDLEDALHVAILSLKEGFEGLMTATNIEIGVTHEGRFHILTVEQISEYLNNII